MAETNKNPFIDAILKDAEAAIDSIVHELRKASNPPAEETPEAPVEEPTQTTSEKDHSLSVVEFSQDAVRALRAAEEWADEGMGQAHIEIADRYIRLAEFAAVYGR